MFENRKRVVLLAAICALAFVSLSAQTADTEPKGNSPYSRFGLGDLVNPLFAAQTAMGGLSAAYNDPFHLNMANPAALGHLMATDLETGFFAKYSSISDGNSSASLWSGNLNYFALGMPIMNPINRALEKKSDKIGLGMGFVLQPYSNVGYNLVTTQQYPEVGEAATNFKGSGGTYRLMWGNGFRYGRFSAGVNIGYLFGKISYDRSVQFNDVANQSYLTRYLDEQSVSGFLWNAGAQLSVPLVKKPEGVTRSTKEKNLILGVYGNSSTGLNTNNSSFHTRYNLTYNDRDTILLETDSIRKGTLPGEVVFGVTYDHSNKLKLGFEYALTAWSAYVNPLQSAGLSNARRISVGIEYVPDMFSYNNYFQRIRYRGGFSHRTDPRSVDGKQLTEYGVSLGLGFPVILPRQQTSFINLTLEGGRFGAGSPLRETYARMTLGFSLNDNSWFFKRKFN